VAFSSIFSSFLFSFAALSLLLLLLEQCHHQQEQQPERCRLGWCQFSPSWLGSLLGPSLPVVMDPLQVVRRSVLISKINWKFHLFLFFFLMVCTAAVADKGEKEVKDKDRDKEDKVRKSGGDKVDVCCGGGKNGDGTGGCCQDIEDDGEGCGDDESCSCHDATTTTATAAAAAAGDDQHHHDHLHGQTTTATKAGKGLLKTVGGASLPPFQQKVRAAAAAAVAAGEIRLKVFYGSQTGTGKTLANDLVAAANAQGWWGYHPLSWLPFLFFLLKDEEKGKHKTWKLIDFPPIFPSRNCQSGLRPQGLRGRDPLLRKPELCVHPLHLRGRYPHHQCQMVL